MPKILLICLTLLFCSCGAQRQMGDPDGVSVEFEVLLDRSFVSAMENRQGRVGVGVGSTVGSHGVHHGVGLGLSFRSTSVYIYGGKAPGQAGIFRRKIKWGSNQFSIPIRPGRELVLTAVVSGGRSGWETVGTCEVQPQGNAIRLVLDEKGGRISKTSEGP